MPPHMPAGSSEKRREEEEGLIQAGGSSVLASASRQAQIGRKGLAVLECFRAWAFANPRRFLSGALTAALVIGLLLFKLLYHPPAPPSPWRAQCRADFPTHYAFRLPPLPPDHSLPPPHHPGPRPPRRPSTEVDNRQVIHSIQPLTPSHPAWPYSAGHPPSLADADSMDPVGVLLGVFTMDKEAERRQLIRSTYMVHPESRKAGTEGVRVLFVMGRPGKEYAEKIALESELYGDILMLDIHENMNDGKTHAYFAWAAEHAQVPNCKYSYATSAYRTDTTMTTGMNGDNNDEGQITSIYERSIRERKMVCKGTRQPDYVVKADDDSFIVLSELERRLRIVPREKAYWGLLMYGGYLQFAERSEYMAGEGYALSMDLVKFVATDKYVLDHRIGDEDQRVGDWIRAHPKAEEVIWVTERCWMYDHPKARKVLSHGFMFPDVFRSIQDDSDSYLPPHLPHRVSSTWSTVSPYNRPYRPPIANLTVSQRIEAMVEGSPLSMLHAHNRQYSHDSLAVAPDEGARTMEERIRDAWIGRPTREERMAGGEETGSTVLVHKVRKDEWWIETALALLGP